MSVSGLIQTLKKVKEQQGYAPAIPLAPKPAPKPFGMMDAFNTAPVPRSASQIMDSVASMGTAPKQDTRSNISKFWDQINPLDNGRSIATPTPTTNRSVIGTVADTGKAIVRAPIQIANTTKAGVGLGYGLLDTGYQSIFGTDQSYNNVLKGVDKTLHKDISSNSGLFGIGTPWSSPEQLQQESIRQLAGKTINAGVQTAQLVAPSIEFMANPLVNRVANNAVQSVVGSGVSQAVENGNVSIKQLARDTATGVALGEGGNLVHNFAGKGISKSIEFVKKDTPKVKVNTAIPDTVPIVEPPKVPNAEKTITQLMPEVAQKAKIKKTGIQDAKLKELTQARQSVIDVAAEEKLSQGRNITKEILQNGGISSSAYEDLPSSLKRKTGPSADYMAKTLGFESEDALMEAISNRSKPLTKSEARALAEEELLAGKHPYSKDFAEIDNAVKARQDELTLYPQGKKSLVKIKDKAPSSPPDAELLSLMNTPEAQMTPRNTKYSNAKGKQIRNIETDRMAQEMIKNGAGRDEIASLYMSKDGKVLGDALKEADTIMGFTQPPDTIPNKVKAGDPLTIEGKAMKDPAMKKMMHDISNNTTLSNVDAKVTAARVIEAAKANGVDTADKGFIDRYQTGKITDPNEMAVAKVIQEETDRIFKLQQSLDPNIEYRQNYLPQSYEQPLAVVQDATRKFSTKTGAGEARQFKTYAEAAQYGLAPKYNSVEEMLADSTRRVQASMANKEIVNSGIESGLFSTTPVDNTWKTIDGFNHNGAPVYASAKAASVINNALQESTNMLSKTVKGLGKLNTTWQDVMLAGGAPYTPANFFVFGQMVKEMTAGRFSVAKDFVYSFSDELTRKRFAENADLVRGLAAEGVPFNIKDPIKSESWLAGKWGDAINKPTFERFMPNQYLSVAEHAYEKFSKTMSKEEALSKAAKVTREYYGVVDQIAKGRSTDVQNAINAAFFAPKYRETILNSMFNTGKSIIDPRTWNDPTYYMNRRLAAGMAVTLVGAEMLQRKISGHGLLDNRNGQELSIEISMGKDEKGNEKVINIPLLPGFLTLPRAAVAGISDAFSGDTKGAIGGASKVLATPLQVGGQVIGNADYFGRPIYTDQKTADQEGINPDSAPTMAKKIAGYVAGQAMPGYGRAIKDAVTGKSGLEVAAQAGELPLRFGKKLKPETAAYFKDRDQIYGSLNKNDKAVWDTIHPKLKNVNGEYITDPTVYSSAARAVNYLNNENVLKAENEMAKRARDRGEKTDPLFSLDDKKQRIALTIATLPPKDPQIKKLKKDNAWYSDYSKSRAAFFDSLPASDPNKPKGPIEYPEASGKVSSLIDAYNQLEDATMKRKMLDNNPEIADQFAKEEQYSRAVRAAKMLPQYDKYPEPTPEVQKLIDEYTALPKNESANGKSKTRSSWIKAHPTEWAKMTEQFDKQATYNLEQDAQMAAFEGEDFTNKGITAIKSLAKSLESADGTANGKYGSGNGYDNNYARQGDFGQKRTLNVASVKIKKSNVKVQQKSKVSKVKIIRNKK